MRRVFTSNREVCHVWSARTQDEGHTKNIKFEEDVIFSYGHHFPMARHIRGVDAWGVLITVSRCSQTTAGHLCRVRRAVHHLPNWHVPDLYPEDNGHRHNRDHFGACIESLTDRVLRARSLKRLLLNTLHGLVTEANAYAAFFGLPQDYRVPPRLDLPAQEALGVHFEELAARLCEKKEAECRRRRDEWQRQRDQFIAGYREDVARWRAGAKVQLPDVPWELRDTDGVALRVKGSRIQTSMGVTVSIDDAVRLLELVRSGQEVRFPWWFGPDGEDPAPHVGPYRVTHVLANGDVHIACHFIKREEIERVAALLGLWEGESPPDWYAAILDVMEPAPRPERGDFPRRRRTIRPKAVVDE